MRMRVISTNWREISALPDLVVTDADKITIFSPKSTENDQKWGEKIFFFCPNQVPATCSPH